MAGFFQQVLRGAVDGFLGTPNLKDYTHASKTFRSTGYSNAPKFKWLFHVYFDINKLAIAGNNLDQIFPETANYGLLVKTIDLPKFSFDTQLMNQYNRKRYVQTKINYEPIRISFHDDNANQLRQLWYNYYSYYYNDPSNPQGPVSAGGNNSDQVTTLNELNTPNTYSEYNPKLTNWGYTGEISDSNLLTSNVRSPVGTQTTPHKYPFFRSIKIYGFNQHSFALYTLVNPIIKSFEHDTYNYSDGTGIMENTMTLQYESVKYYEGAVNGMMPGEKVEGFGDPGVYDTELSPIARPGSNASILGPNGLVESGIGILDDLASGDPRRILRAAQTTGRLSQTFKNGQQILQTAQGELVRGALGAITGSQLLRNVGVAAFPAIGAQGNVRSQLAPVETRTPFAPPPVRPPFDPPNSAPVGP